MRDVLNLGLLSSFLLAAAVSGFATQYSVQPGESIQSAIDTAQEGDEIILMPGTHAHNNLLVTGKNITIRSTEPNDPAVVAATIIDPGLEILDQYNWAIPSLVDLAHTVITFRSSAGTLVTNATQLLGITIQGGIVCATDPHGGGGAILCYGAGPTIKNCVLLHNRAYDYPGSTGEAAGGAICCIACDDTTNPAVTQPRIENCELRWNQAATMMKIIDEPETWTPIGGGRGGAIACYHSSPTIVGNIIADNLAGPSCGLEGETCGEPEPEGLELLAGLRSSAQAGPTSYGGGIDLRMGQAVVSDNVLTGNIAHVYKSSTAFLGMGGFTARGGGISVQGETLLAGPYLVCISGCAPTFGNNWFESNQALVRLWCTGWGSDGYAVGGGMAIGVCCEINETNNPCVGNTFVDNRAEVLTYNPFVGLPLAGPELHSGDSARAAGGGAWINGGDVTIGGDDGSIEALNTFIGNLATIVNVQVDSNDAEGVGLAAYGGAIAASPGLGGQITLRNMTAYDNIAEAGDSASGLGWSPATWIPDEIDWAYFPAFGGGVAVDGAVIALENALLARNAATVSGAGNSLGGGIALVAGAEQGLISGCTIVSNEADIGGGVGLTDFSYLNRYISAGPAAERGLWNTILWDNVAAIPNLGSQAAALYRANADVDYCDAQGGLAEMYIDPSYDGATITWGAGNIDADPLFVNPGGNFHLRGTSPCIDAGDPSGVYTGQADIDFQPRVLNGSIDIGADEYGPTVIYGDMNCDGVVDFGDINPFVTAILGQAQYEAAYPNCRWLNGDLNGNGSVGFEDINIFVAWLTA